MLSKCRHNSIIQTVKCAVINKAANISLHTDAARYSRNVLHSQMFSYYIKVR